MRGYRGDLSILERLRQDDLPSLNRIRQDRKDAADEIERLRGHLHQHFAFARFVHLWVNRDNATDAERVSVIKHHPSLRKWVEGIAHEQSAKEAK